MKNFIQCGDNVILPAPAAVSSGDLVIVGNTAGVAHADAASGADVCLATEGVFTLPKRLSATFASGAVVSWSLGSKFCDAPGSGLYPIGAAMKAAGNAATTVNVRLAGIPTAAAS